MALEKGGTLGLLSPMSILEVQDIEIVPFKKALSRQVWNKSTYILIMGHSTILFAASYSSWRGNAQNEQLTKLLHHFE